MTYIFIRRFNTRLLNGSALNQLTRIISTQNNYDHKYKKNSHYFEKFAIGGAIATFLGYQIYHNHVFAKELLPKENENAGKFRRGLPEYSMDEILKHASKDAGIWVTFKEGVYDITKFVDEHPGGDQILMAAGNSVEPFWNLYGIHKNPHVYDILESYRIGNLNSHEVTKEDMSDPYSDDPKRHSILKPASIKPFNAESPTSLLVDNFITPNELFYVRNHLPVPNVDPKTYELEIEVEGKSKTHSFNLAQLKKLPKTTITATIMCAGNRRSEMTKAKPVKGLNWGAAAVGNAKWTGVLLRDVLKSAGITEENCGKFKHVQFEGIDLDVTGKTYGASIPIWKAFDKRADILLAYEMNGVPIPRDHGYPIRVIVPGVVGARNVKWLSKVVLSERESDSHWQQNDYKGFSPSTDAASADYSKSPSIQELPVISAICKPGDGETVTMVDGHVVVKGYAWSGGGQRIVRVDVTGDGGKTWHVANFDSQDAAEAPQHWSWTLWSVRVPVERGKRDMEIWVKAVDSCYNSQPETFENIWNFRGVLSNAYHRINVKIQR